LHFANTIAAITNKGIFQISEFNTGSGSALVFVGTAARSYLYHIGRPHASLLFHKLARSVFAIGRIRLQGFPPPFEDLVRSVNITLVSINTFTQEETNSLYSSSYFQPEQFQNRVLDIQLAQPIILQPHQFIILDIPGTWPGPDIVDETPIMNISLQNCEEASLDRGTV
jgi:hypothetical protein